MTPRFGTDGLRGKANAELTPELVMALGRAAARVLSGDRFVVGRDTRLSGPMLFAALTAGIVAEGADVDDLGICPTPGVAWVSADENTPAAVISASHNPFDDNGVKFFARGGLKLTDTAEAEIEAELERILADPLAAATGPTGAALGRIRAHSSGRQRYAEAMTAQLEAGSLRGLSIVLDCAHGATFEVAPAVLTALGATVTVINDQPDGININEGAGTGHPEGLARTVTSVGADLGLAFDGDGDRVLAVDHSGAVVDGDQILAICALDRQRHGRLKGDTLVVTVMANLGLRQVMAANDIGVFETKVGDRYVLEALDANGWCLGGEQSGHIIFRDLATTGDGLLTGLQLLDVMTRTGQSLAELAKVMHRHPQVLRNVVVADRLGLAGAADVWEEVRSVEARLGDDGRVLIRVSGTEPLVRVMVEAASAEEAQAACDSLCEAVTRSLGGLQTP
ncbi:MAG: phosphoglucosamine mutase [Actinomycetota bacterium]|nr:phosphoglucosamine mutase [Actinomycetota bacterium]